MFYYMIHKLVQSQIEIELKKQQEKQNGTQ